MLVQEEQREEDVGLRYSVLQEDIQNALRSMSLLELEGATRVLEILHGFLDNLHFTEKRVLNRRAFVKTVEDLYETCSDEICEHGNEPQ